MLKNFLRLAAASALFAVSINCAAQTAGEFSDLGERAYRNGNFQAAAENFSRAAALEPSAANFHNAGNAYVKLSKPGLARLNYERARYINPRSPDTRINLANVARESGDPAGSSLADTVFGELSNSEWAWLLILSLWGAVICFFVIPPFVRRARGARACGTLFAALLVFSLCGCVYWAKVRSTAVSVSPDALLRISPAANAPASHSIAEGKSAKIIKRSGDYVLVEFPEGKYGWCRTDMLEPVWPPKKG